MPDVVSNDELNALAAEYVLGTLDYEERKGAASLMEVDHAFRGLVRIWERRFGELHLMVEPVEPDPKIWERIRGKLADQLPPEKPPAAETPAADMPSISAPDSGTSDVELPGNEAPVAPALPDGDAAAPAEGQVAEAPSISPAVEPHVAEARAKLFRELEEASRLVTQTPPSPKPQPLLRREEPDEGVVETPRPVRRWRLLAVLMSLVALALAGLIGTWRYAPNWLPEQLRATSLLHLVEPAPPPIPKPRRPPPPDFDE